MTYLRKKVVYDTQIISYALAGTIPPRDWSLVSQYLSEKCRYCVSLNTLIELVVGLARGDDAHFVENVNRIRLLCSPPKVIFLPLVGEFVRTRVFHELALRQDYSPAKIKLWLRIIMKAKDRCELTSGTVALQEPGRSRTNFGFNLDMVVRQAQNGKDAHSQALKDLRTNKLLRPTQQQWAASVILSLKTRLTNSKVGRLCSALDAAYQYESCLYDLAQNNSYDFSKHDSDWLDLQQLYYLADPSVVLVTLDSKIKLRSARSHQLGQILDFEQLKAQAKS